MTYRLDLDRNFEADLRLARDPEKAAALLFVAFPGHDPTYLHGSWWLDAASVAPEFFGAPPGPGLWIWTADITFDDVYNVRYRRPDGREWQAIHGELSWSELGPLWGPEPEPEPEPAPVEGAPV